MVSSFKVYCWSCVVACLAAGLHASCLTAQGEEFRLESVGARGGMAANNSSRYFNQAEFIADWNLPWGWELGEKWHLQSRLDLSAGWFGDFGNNAAIGTAGPSLVLAREHFPISLVGGVSPTLLSRTIFGSKDFGINFQFTTHIGVDVDFTRHWRFTYQFQHMSNAHLSSKNPALNMHLFGLSYVF